MRWGVHVPRPAKRMGAMSRTHLMLCCALLLIVAGVIQSGTAIAQVSARDSRAAQLLAHAKSWGYQLQNLNPDERCAHSSAARPARRRLRQRSELDELHDGPVVAPDRFKALPAALPLDV